ncbi:MAG: cytochrome c3 family protein [Candidatus Binatia bacterium]
MTRSHLMWVTLLSSLSCLTVMCLGNAAAQTVLPKACVDCHGSEPKFPVRGVRSEYVTSGHRTLGNASYANADDCQGCHTNEGFIQRVKTGKVDTKKFVSNPSEIGCFTCHAPHDSGNFSLRTVAKVSLANGQVLEKDKANLCAQCHQARRTPKDEVRARNIPTDSWGAHHGPQADMLAGTNAYEFPGKKYASSVHTALPNANCVTCHMTLPAGRYSLAPSIGGHSFRIAGEVHEEHRVNTAGCTNSGCHAEMKQVTDTHYFDKRAAADYDGDGKTETVQEEVTGLLDKLINSKGTGLLQTMKDAPYDAKGNFANSKTQYPIETVAALYNYKFVLEDGSKGVHNTTYAVQLLMDSIKALDKSFDDSKRP